ncbi:methyltransferase [Shewanella sp. C32]|uniref:Methyltransferase n=1 Tax=Shewanella electrica TaxID=515560 RepID=A0ABT2FLA5_9GAMM|nr:methyltransferase [Shewanella electrica]MCH1925566.1 methyltransferase [Shewanella electrica]MCS4557127.1 methyltransferase [Shewanella electrica]
MEDYQLLASVDDEFGSVSVLELGDTRILTFGHHDEQSKLNKKLPHQPQHTYLKAMLLSLLYGTPRRVIVLGLGGGLLVHALRNFDPAIKITAVELRQSVIAIAKQYFMLPLSKKLTVVQQDAAEYMATRDDRRVDAIYCDLFHADGMQAFQRESDFLDNCLYQLKDNGLLVLNCWKEARGDAELRQRLLERFADVRACLTGSGNWVIFAARRPQLFSQAALKQQAQQMSAKLAFDLSQPLTRFEEWR